MRRNGSRCQRAGVKKIICMLFLILLLPISGCTGDAEPFSYFSLQDDQKKIGEEDGRIIILTHSQEEDNPIHEAAKEFKRQLETLTDGAYQVKIYPANTYGRVAGGYDAVKNGTIEMRIGGNSGECSDIISWLPAFLDVAPEDLVMKLREGGDLYEMMLEDCQQDGCHLLGVMTPTYRVMTSNRAVYSIEDFNGLNIRTMDQEAETLFWTSLGANTNSVYDIDKVYTALQMGLIDSEENSIEVIYSRRFYEYQDYLIKSNHRFQINSFYINEEFWNTLSGEDQAKFKSAVNYALNLADEHAETMWNTYEQVLQENMEILELPDSEKNKIRQTAGAAVREWLKGLYGEENISRIIESIE